MIQALYAYMNNKTIKKRKVGLELVYQEGKRETFKNEQQNLNLKTQLQSEEKNSSPANLDVFKELKWVRHSGVK
jgi:hypothetical protein